MAVNYGSKRVVVGAHYGLRDWLAQRVSEAVSASPHAPQVSSVCATLHATCVRLLADLRSVGQLLRRWVFGRDASGAMNAQRSQRLRFLLDVYAATLRCAAVTQPTPGGCRCAKGCDRSATTTDSDVEESKTAFTRSAAPTSAVAATTATPTTTSSFRALSNSVLSGGLTVQPGDSGHGGGRRRRRRRI